MTEFQREVLRQIKQGIDRARHEGVLVEYPRGALIDGDWVSWPFYATSGEGAAAGASVLGSDKPAEAGSMTGQAVMRQHEQR